MVSSHALRPGWTPLTIGLMVLGFIFFWPLGFVMLAYILWGERIPEMRSHFRGTAREWSREARGCGFRTMRSGNAAFDDYRANELRRLEEERRKLDEELRAFEGYMRDLRRARDQEEFDRFMRDRAAKPKPANGDSIDL